MRISDWSSDVCSSESKYLPVLLEYYGENLARHSEAYPGLMDAMDELHARGIKLAICTNKYERFATALIDQMGLTQRFDAIIGGDPMGSGKSKPHAAPVEEMIQRCGGGRTVFWVASLNEDWLSVVSGKRVSVRDYLGGSGYS